MKKIIELQREYFLNGNTLDLDFRREQLLKLKESILAHYDDVVHAFKQDYNKCEFDVVTTEISMVLKELNFMLKNMKKLARPKRIKTSIINFKSSGRIYPEPFGVCLIVAPWNYPFQLSLIPVIDAIATGNTVILKLSVNTPEVSKAIGEILSVFDNSYVYVTKPEDREKIFEQDYDFCFYTGSTKTAKELIKQQAKYLTPCVLELGGKSPCIVDEDADIALTAKRLTWGKFLNAGQTCVAPDYVCVHEKVLPALLGQIKKNISDFYYDNSVLTPNFTQVITENKAKELYDLIKNENIVIGGKYHGRTFEPTVLTNISFDSPIMQEEIFGPILPIITFSDIHQLIAQLKQMEKPLAFYYFGKNNAKLCVEKCSFGGGCINETIMHLTEEKLPFGGIGFSGMGSYHGKKSFETFSHYKSVLKKGKLELPVKYPPYTEKKLNLVKWMFGINKKR